nr:hypothetical protein [uncultured bacterium]
MFFRVEKRLEDQIPLLRTAQAFGFDMLEEYRFFDRKFVCFLPK